MKINVAIVGLGIMGRRMLEHMSRHESFVPVSMWDPNPEGISEPGLTFGFRMSGPLKSIRLA